MHLFFQTSFALWAMPLIPSAVLICVCFDMKGQEGRSFLRDALKRARCSLKVVSEESGASLKKEVGDGGCTRRNKVKLLEMSCCSFLCKVCSDGEAGCSKRCQTEDSFDGGPVAAEDGVPLSVIQFHKSIPSPVIFYPAVKGSI